MSAAAAGWVNAHTHLYGALAELGMPEPSPPPPDFLAILQSIWWRLDRALDEESLRAGARYYLADALLHGTTGLIDHHESPAFIAGSLDVLADACQELGMPAVLCYGATERNGGRAEAEQGLEECHRFLVSNDRPLVRGVVGLHASFTVEDETIRQAGEMARSLDTVLHVHLAEDLADVEDAQRRGHAGPLERLEQLDALPRGSILAHGVHLDEEQVRRCARRGWWLVQNPRSNRNNRVGYPRALAASEQVALGSDGFPSRPEEEMAALLEEAAEHGDDPLRAEARRAAGAYLLAERFGGNPPPAPRVVDNGRLLSGDLDAIRSRAAKEAERLWKRMEAL